MTIEKTINGTEAVFKLEGWLDTQTSPQLGSELDTLPDGVTALVLDLEKLEYISSAGLRQVVAAHKKMNGELTVVNVSAEILDVFTMTGFDKKLNIK